MGITALYLTSVFQSASNHRYQIYDYYQVDSMLGGNPALRRTHPALRRGEYSTLLARDDVYVFGRRFAGETLVVAFNVSRRAISPRIPVSGYLPEGRRCKRPGPAMRSG